MKQRPVVQLQLVANVLSKILGSRHVRCPQGSRLITARRRKSRSTPKPTRWPRMESRRRWRTSSSRSAGIADAERMPDNERLYLETEWLNCLRVDYQPSRDAWDYGHRNYDGERPRRTLIRFDASSNTVHTYPLRTGPSLRTLGSKYGPIGEIAFEGSTSYYPTTKPKSKNRCINCLIFLYTMLIGLGIRPHPSPYNWRYSANHFRRLVISELGIRRSKDQR